MWPAPWSILSEPFKLRWFDIADPTRPGSKVNSTSCGSSSFHHLQSLWCPRQLALVSMTTAASAVACSVLDVKMEERYEHKVPLPLFLLPSFPQVNLPHTHTGWSKWIKKNKKMSIYLGYRSEPEHSDLDWVATVLHHIPWGAVVGVYLCGNLPLCVDLSEFCFSSLSCATVRSAVIHHAAAWACVKCHTAFSEVTAQFCMSHNHAAHNTLNYKLKL